MKKHDLPCVLGGISPQEFMRVYWQKKPLLIRQAIPGMQALLSRKELFELASEQDVESRLVSGDGDAQPWRMQHGPFKPRALPPLSRPNWTLLVQGVDLHLDEFAALRDRFRFIPDARLDDVMVSYASDGGGVGPHFDSYDVFLLQAHGQRRWRISAQKNLALRDDVPLKILSQFKSTKTMLLEPGDMLYLPPHYAHEGVAVGECMTYSIGFRAPEMRELTGELLSRMSDTDADGLPMRYRDPGQSAAVRPAEIPAALQQFALDGVYALLQQRRALDCVLGEVLTEPKAEVWFAAQNCPARFDAVHLDIKSRMLYDKHFVFINGESYRCQGEDARWLRTLANQRRLEKLKGISPPLSALLRDWVLAGWVHCTAVGRRKNRGSGNHL
jgi:50S ribosomal protein L16 3-hydroxylase